MVAGGFGAEGDEMIRSAQATPGLWLIAIAAALAIWAATANANTLAITIGIAAASATTAAAATAVIGIGAVCGRRRTTCRDLGAHHVHVVGVMQEEGGMLLATNQHANLRVGDRKRVVKHRLERGLIGRGVVRALNCGLGGHHHVVLLTQVFLVQVATRFNHRLTNALEMDCMVGAVATSGVKGRT